MSPSSFLPAGVYDDLFISHTLLQGRTVFSCTTVFSSQRFRGEGTLLALTLAGQDHMDVRRDLHSPDEVSIECTLLLGVLGDFKVVELSPFDPFSFQSNARPHYSVPPHRTVWRMM